jgi:hypothetical protein
METENTINLLCPCCKSKLEYTHSDTYQDLSEHVSDPNSTPSIKSAFQCPNIECIANHTNVAWIENGDFYVLNRLSEDSWSALIEFTYTDPSKGYAINSWSYHYELGRSLIKSKTRKIKIGKYLVEIKPKAKGYDYPIEEEYQPRRFGWDFEFWKKTDDDNYTNVTLIYPMVRYCLQSFNSSYKSVKYNSNNRTQIKDALEFAFGYRWGIKDDRYFAQIASFIIRKIYPARVKYLISQANCQNIKYKN